MIFLFIFQCDLYNLYPCTGYAEYKDICNNLLVSAGIINHTEEEYYICVLKGVLYLSTNNLIFLFILIFTITYQYANTERDMVSYIGSAVVIFVPWDMAIMKCSMTSMYTVFPVSCLIPVTSSFGVCIHIHWSSGIMTPEITIYQWLHLETSMENVPHWQQC